MSRRVNICSGYPTSSLKGNTVTAFRLARLLNERGQQATVMHGNEPPSADVNIALHALKTAAATRYFRRHNPRSTVIVLLTGTDYDCGIDQNPRLANDILECTDAFVLAQPASLKQLPVDWREKTTVICPSVDLPEAIAIQRPELRYFSNVGHLRRVKNPHLMFEAMQQVNRSDFLAYSIGACLETIAGQQAIVNTRNDPRYRWVDGCPHGEAISWLTHSLATINTSFSEGGANTIVEAINLGVPVLASRIDGNVGLLGQDYEGYFASDDATALAGLMTRCLNDPTYPRTLRQQLKTRQPNLTNQAEGDRWLELIVKLEQRRSKSELS